MKCPVEETHGQQPKESQCDQYSHAGVGDFNKGIHMCLVLFVYMIWMCVFAVRKGV